MKWVKGKKGLYPQTHMGNSTTSDVALGYLPRWILTLMGMWAGCFCALKRPRHVNSPLRGFVASPILPAGGDAVGMWVKTHLTRMAASIQRLRIWLDCRSEGSSPLETKR